MDRVLKARRFKEGREDNCRPWSTPQFGGQVRARTLVIEGGLGNSPLPTPWLRAAPEGQDGC
jgi:hypothetical protein